MTRRSTVRVSFAAVLIGASALSVLVLKQYGLPVISTKELTLKTFAPPSPPDDNCSQAQRTPGRSAHKDLVRETNTLGEDERAIYQAVLELWNSEPRKPLNLSNKTTPLDRNISNCECLTGIDVQSLEKATRSFHFLPGGFLRRTLARLVDAESQSVVVQTSDPGKSIRSDTSINAAVDEAFANGLLELSEIAFDRNHHRAIVSYSFRCGSLCGSSGVWLFEKVDGVWKKSERVCGGWVS